MSFFFFNTIFIKKKSLFSLCMLFIVLICVFQPGSYVSKLHHNVWRHWRLPFWTGQHCPGCQSHGRSQQGGTIHYKWESPLCSLKTKNKNKKKERKEKNQKKRKMMMKTDSWQMWIWEGWRWEMKERRKTGKTKQKNNNKKQSQNNE